MLKLVDVLFCFFLGQSCEVLPGCLVEEWRQEASFNIGHCYQQNLLYRQDKMRPLCKGQKYIITVIEILMV